MQQGDGDLITGTLRGPDVIGKINGDVNQTLAQKDVIDRFTNLGAVPFSTTPAQFSRIAHDDIVKWAKVVRESGATVD